MWDFRERSSTFSLEFPAIRPSVSGGGKKQSCSPRQGLRVGTSFGEFRQTPRGRGFLLLGLFFI